MEKYVVAVSGGVDSVVLLDMLVKQGNHELIVAHFDHGIRTTSANDARFVEDLAKKYCLKFEGKRMELGAGASEELARGERYKFLRSVAKKYDAKIVTAHHLDDLVETIAINLIRGTGWRGLAAMDSPDILRPLIKMEKSQNLTYAHQNNLQWCEDQTNYSDKYLRNRVRARTMKMSHEDKMKLFDLWSRQKQIKNDIKQEVVSLLPNEIYSRYFFIMIDWKLAREVLRVLTKGRLTRPQLDAAVKAIKVMRPGKIYQAGGGVSLLFTARNFRVKLIK